MMLFQFAKEKGLTWEMMNLIPTIIKIVDVLLYWI